MYHLWRKNYLHLHEVSLKHFFLPLNINFWRKKNILSGMESSFVKLALGFFDIMEKMSKESVFQFSRKMKSNFWINLETKFVFFVKYAFFFPKFSFSQNFEKRKQKKLFIPKTIQHSKSQHLVTPLELVLSFKDSS